MTSKLYLVCVQIFIVFHRTVWEQKKSLLTHYVVVISAEGPCLNTAAGTLFHLLQTNVIAHYRSLRRNFYLQESFHKPIFGILNRLNNIDKKSKHHRLVTNIEKGYPFSKKKVRLF